MNIIMEVTTVTSLHLIPVTDNLKITSMTLKRQHCLPCILTNALSKH